MCQDDTKQKITRRRETENYKATIPRVDFPHKLLLSFTQSSFSVTRSRKEQPSKSVAGPVLTAFARHIAPRRATPRWAERAAGEERWSHLSRFSLFLYPRLIFPSHAYAYALPSYSYAMQTTDRLGDISNIFVCLDEFQQGHFRRVAPSCNQKFESKEVQWRVAPIR